MSLRCKVCNALKITHTDDLTDVNWECQSCGNILDANGHVIASN
jgi:ribosomal protein S27E